MAGLESRRANRHTTRHPCAEKGGLRRSIVVPTTAGLCIFWQKAEYLSFFWYHFPLKSVATTLYYFSPKRTTSTRGARTHTHTHTHTHTLTLTLTQHTRARARVHTHTQSPTLTHMHVSTTRAHTKQQSNEKEWQQKEMEKSKPKTNRENNRRKRRKQRNGEQEKDRFRVKRNRTRKKQESLKRCLNLHVLFGAVSHKQVWFFSYADVFYEWGKSFSRKKRREGLSLVHNSYY